MALESHFYPEPGSCIVWLMLMLEAVSLTSTFPARPHGTALASFFWLPPISVTWGWQKQAPKSAFLLTQCLFTCASVVSSDYRSGAKSPSSILQRSSIKIFLLLSRQTAEHTNISYILEKAKKMSWPQAYTRALNKNGIRAKLVQIGPARHTH